MSMYLPLLLIFAQKPHHKANALFLFLETWLWDRPLYLWAHIVNMTGSRGFAPFISHIRSKEEASNGEGFICLGSWPLESDVSRHFVGEGDGNASTSSEKYNIGCVVNLCREYGGPTTEYMKHNILQFYSPLPDMKEPTWSSVLEAVSFLTIFRANSKNKGKRAFIHCKGGRARSGTIVICYLLTTINNNNNTSGKKERYTLSEAFTLMRSCRRIVDHRLPTYKVVQRFNKELEENDGIFDRLLMRYVIDSKKRTLRSVKEYN